MADLLQAIEEALEGDGCIEGQRFADEDLSRIASADLSAVEFTDVTFLRCSFANVYARRASFEDCELVACDLANADLRMSFWRRTTLRDCRATGVDLYQAILSACTIDDSAFDFANLAEAKLERVTLRNTKLAEASLAHLHLRGKLLLENCDLTRTELFGTLLRGIDLSTCDISGIRLSDGYRELRGAKVAAEQMVQLASLLGVTVID